MYSYFQPSIFHFFFNLSFICRFLFILLGPLGKGQQYHEIGRSIATLMTDEVFLLMAFIHFVLTEEVCNRESPVWNHPD